MAMKLKKEMLGPILGIFLAGCASIKVASDYDPSANFSGLETYDWVSSTQPKTGDARLDSDILNSRIRQAVENQLGIKGYQKATDGTPDFLIAYMTSIEQKLDVSTFHYGYGYPSGYSFRRGFGGPAYTSIPSSETYVDQYDEGTLLLDIVNPQTKKLIWRGTAVDTVQKNDSPEKREERINKAVADMLQKFPPQ
jgi:hypothetical protein